MATIGTKMEFIITKDDSDTKDQIVLLSLRRIAVRARCAARFLRVRRARPTHAHALTRAARPRPARNPPARAAA